MARAVVLADPIHLRCFQYRRGSVKVQRGPGYLRKRPSEPGFSGDLQVVGALRPGRERHLPLFDRLS